MIDAPMQTPSPQFIAATELTANRAKVSHRAGRSVSNIGGLLAG
ncbi:hypothetical protein [Gymnodinialimonas sp. 57CJ19]